MMLTERQHEIATLAARGMCDKRIARELGVAPNTVHNHLIVVYRKLGITGHGRALLAHALRAHVGVRQPRPGTPARQGATRLRTAAARALDALREVQKLDAAQGRSDPDVEEAIDALESALRYAARARPATIHRDGRRKTNRWNFAPLETLTVTHGRMRGHTVRFLAAANSKAIYVDAAGQRAVVLADYVERMA